MVPNHEKKRDYYVNPCFSKFKNDSKNGGRKSFSYETKTSIYLFIPISKMRLWFLMMRKKETIMWIHFYPNWQTNFYSKKWWKEKLFLAKPKHWFIYPNEQNEFMVPNHEKNGDCYMNLCLSILTNELLFLKMVEREAFLMKPKHQWHLAQ